MLISKKRSLLLIALLFGFFLHGFSQKAGITINDGRNGEAIAFAHVLFESLNSQSQISGITDINGFVENPLKEKGIFKISYVGYQKLYDTISPGNHLKVKLKPLTYNIDEVVVTGQYTPQAVDKSIFRIKVIGARQIDQRASNNLSELMAGELNIRSSKGGVLGSSITLQGLKGEHIKFLVDGVPVIGRMNGNIDLDQLNLYNVAHIEIIEGPMSVIYGSNALAGVINIITKQNNYSNYQTNANAYVESVGVYNFSADASVKKGRWSGSVAGARNFFGGYSAENTERSDKWKPKRQYNADGSLQYAHKELKARLSASYFNELLMDKGSLLEPYYETAFDNHFKTNRLTTNMDLNTRLFKDRYLNVIASYSYYDRVKNNYSVDLTTLDKLLTLSPEDQDTTKFNQYLLRAEFSKSTDKSPFNYQLGIDLNHESGTGKRMLDARQEIGDYAAFLTVKIKPALRLMLQPGLRYSYNTKYDAPVTYSLNLKYDISPRTSFRASYGKGFRAPSLKELYLEFVDINHNILGNENLEAEHGQNVNLALRYSHEKETYDYGAELSLFYNNIDNSIRLLPLDLGSLLYTYINIHNLITQGYQLNFNNRIYPWLEIKLGIGQTGRKEVYKQAEENKMVYSTDIITQLNYLWRLTDLRFNVYYKYTGDYPDVFLGDENILYQTIVSGYNTLDISVSKQLLRNRITLQIGAKNLFDNTNVNVKGDSRGGGIHETSGSSSPVGWGRTYFVRMNISLKKF